jgi:hypothetical protein
MLLKTAAPLIATLFLCLANLGAYSPKADVLVEAESFSDIGGWVIDQQVMDQMGSPYLLAHGLGRIVKDATTTVAFPKNGTYRIWVRTRDWVGQWKTPDTRTGMRASGYPGKFQLIIDGETLSTDFGTEKAQWHWQDGGTIEVGDRQATLTLRDLTGFNGRCDAILFSSNLNAAPSDSLADLRSIRNELLGFSDTPTNGGHFDFVVVGGGVAGTCAAISAARHGCRVALIQNRPVLGGNNSSEVRVGLSGLIHQKPYPMLGNLVDEIGPIGHWNLWEANENPNSERSKRIFDVMEKHPEKKIHNGGPASNYEDQRKLDAALAEENLSLFLNTHVDSIEMDGKRIVAVTGQNLRTGERIRFTGGLFADCTGDGNLGAIAKADYRVGRESKDQTGEELAPEKADQLVMGTSVQWNSMEEPSRSTFPATPWAVPFTAETCIKDIKGDWDWETGADRDQISEFEHIRDYALRITFGNWSVLKNDEKFKDEFANRRLSWVAYIGGKRESRRLLGDVILCQHDIVRAKEFPDACVTTTWTIDLHYPKEPVCACDAFQANAEQLKIEPYPIPFRTLYSRNIDNLMMAGRNISVTHIALGTVRVQRTTGMMGEVLGMAAGICKKRTTSPRGVYESHLGEFKKLLVAGVPPHKP